MEITLELNGPPISSVGGDPDGGEVVSSEPNTSNNPSFFGLQVVTSVFTASVGSSVNGFRLQAAAKRPARGLSCGPVSIAQPDEAAHVVGKIGDPQPSAASGRKRFLT